MISYVDKHISFVNKCIKRRHSNMWIRKKLSERVPNVGFSILTNMIKWCRSRQ